MTTNPLTPHSRLSGSLSALKTLDERSQLVRTQPKRPPPRSSLTEEQAEAVASGARRIKVQAFAGAGKTTLLRAFAERSIRAKGIYLAFNQSIARQASIVFPDNVACLTHNAMALRALGARDASWRSLAHGKLDQVQARHLTELPGQGGLNLDLVLATLAAFIQSPDEEIGIRHVPVEEARLLGQNSDALDPEKCVRFARASWLRMADPTSQVPMPHDGYLKLWSIAPAELPCDFALIDESQDSNPAFLAGLEKQRCRQVFVGDEHQGIYGFRGAVNALSTLIGCEERSLTLTHRFGPGLCDLANALIRHKGATLFLRSADSSARTQVVLGQAPLGSNPLYLARTNAGLFDKAFELATHGKNFRLLGAEAKLDFTDLQELLALADGDREGRYANYVDLYELEEDALTQGRNDLALRAKLARVHGRRLPAMLAAINAKIESASTQPGSAVPTLSTLHQAKGLEAEWVELLPDFAFAPRPGDAPPTTAEKIEECNVLYVAITRAKKGLAIRAPVVAEWTKTLPPPQSRPAEEEVDLF